MHVILIQLYQSYPGHCPPSLSLSYVWYAVLKMCIGRYVHPILNGIYQSSVSALLFWMNSLTEFEFPWFSTGCGSQKATIIQYITNLSNSKTRVDNMLIPTQILNWCQYLNSGPHARNNHSYKMCHFPYLHSRSHTRHCHHSRIDTPERLILHLYWISWRN